MLFSSEELKPHQAGAASVLMSDDDCDTDVVDRTSSMTPRYPFVAESEYRRTLS